MYRTLLLCFTFTMPRMATPQRSRVAMKGAATQRLFACLLGERSTMLIAPRPLTKSVETQRHDKGPKMSCFHISSLASNQIDLGEECHGMDVSRAQGSHDEAHSQNISVLLVVYIPSDTRSAASAAESARTQNQCSCRVLVRTDIQHHRPVLRLGRRRPRTPSHGTGIIGETGRIRRHGDWTRVRARGVRPVRAQAMSHILPRIPAPALVLLSQSQDKRK